MKSINSQVTPTPVLVFLPSHIAPKTNRPRSETIRKTASYREPFKSRRCLIPVNGFYEWQKTATGKQPYYITLQSGGVMAFAGIFDRWKSPAGEIVESFANATCDAITSVCPVTNNVRQRYSQTTTFGNL